MEFPEEQVRELEQDHEELDRRSKEMDGSVDEARQQWESAKTDQQIPGALPGPDEADEPGDSHVDLARPGGDSPDDEDEEDEGAEDSS